MTPSEHNERRTLDDDRASTYFEREETIMDSGSPPLMDTFQAAMIADGCWELTGFEESEENYIAAYQHLIDTGAAWQLQGRVGRTARDLIEQELCHA